MQDNKTAQDFNKSAYDVLTVFIDLVDGEWIDADKYKDIMSYSKYKRCVRTIKNALIMNKSHYRLESSKYSRQHRLEKIKFR